MVQVPPNARKESSKPKKVPAKKAAGAKGPTSKGKPTTATPVGPDPYRIVFHPVVTEKTMFNMDNNNTLEFIVATWASKPEILKAVETLFTVKVAKVTTRITKDGKRAVVKFAEGVSAEDIGTRIGVF